MAREQPATFEIGLAMAGAISPEPIPEACSIFFQALDEWQRAKLAGVPDIPNHQVIIKVLSGASAGAITGAIGTVALAEGLRPQLFPAPVSNAQKYRCVLPKLYEAWVVKPRLVAKNVGETDLLSLEDLEPVARTPSVNSVLNSLLLDRIREGALAMSRMRGSTAAYLAKDLHVYLTVSNLRGIPYSIKFQGGAYGMQSDGDRVHYVVTGLGASDTGSRWAAKDAGKQIDVSGLFGPAAPSQDWRNSVCRRLHQAHFRSAWRPEKSKLAQTSTPHVTCRLTSLIQIPPDWPWGKETRDFKFLSVDGGLIDNEPFEYARYTLMKNPPQPNDRLGNMADRAVVMIDPFPEPPSFATEEKPASDIVNVAAALFPALINQARFKPSERIDAVNPDVFSRFLIAPHRQRRDRPQELYAIACGLLGGFGGFLDEEFRAHDYQLGRRNCQRFLKDVFALPSDNPIIREWPAGAQQNTQFQTDTLYEDQTEVLAEKRPRFCIIPLLGSALDLVPSCIS